MLNFRFMATRTIIEENNSSDPTIVRDTKTVVNPDIHTQVVDSKEETIESPNSSTIKQTKVVHDPLVKSTHPQDVYDTKKTIFRSWQVIWLILAVIEILLVFRMLFKAIGANPYSGFVSLVYSITDLLIAPFAGIIKPTISGNSVIEWSIIIAAIVYALIAWGLVYAINMIRPITPEEIERAV